MKNVEEMSIAEMKEFAAKTSIVIPKDKTTRAAILDFIKNPKPIDPVAEARAAHQAREKSQAEQSAKTKEARYKKACKKPLNEKEKAYLAELEVMARSGQTPDTDQMKDLGLLRARAKITKLSVIEQNELAEIEVRRQNPDAVQIPSSGVTEEERFQDLKARCEIQ